VRSLVISATFLVDHPGGGFLSGSDVFMDNFELALRADDAKAKDADNDT